MMIEKGSLGFPFAGLSHVLDIFLRPGPVWADKHSLHAGAKLKRLQGLQENQRREAILPQYMRAVRLGYRMGD